MQECLLKIPKRRGEGTKMKAALYSRCSTDTKRQETENQLLQLREFAYKNNLEIAYELIDYESGTKPDRPAFKQMLMLAYQRKIDVVLFWSLDRFSREGTLPTLQYLKQLESYGVGFKSLTEQYLDSTGLFRDAIISILATLARQESIRLSEREKAAYQKYLASGKKTSTGRPWGRQKVDTCPRIVVCLRDEIGLSWNSIAETLKIGRGTVCRIHASQKAPQYQNITDTDFIEKSALPMVR